MRRLVLPIILVLAFVLEANIRVLGISPNLTVLVVYYVGLRYGHLKGLAMGAGTGALADAAGGGFLGPSLVGKATAGYLARFLREGIFIWTPVLGLIGMAALTALDGLLSYLCTAVFFETPAPLGRAITIVFWQSALNSVAGIYIRPGKEEDAEP
jgi:rod shape-determining protein MreD